MKEEQLARALLKFEAGNEPRVDPRQITRAIVRRDQKRVFFAVTVAITFWVLAIAAIAILLWASLNIVFPRLQVEIGRAASTRPEIYQRVLVSQIDAVAKGTTMVGIAVGILAIATFCTILLVIVSRRATLRQLNANLMDISEQLKLLMREHSRDKGA